MAKGPRDRRSTHRGRGRKKVVVHMRRVGERPISKEDETQLIARLSALHSTYYRREGDTTVKLADIKMRDIRELQDTFDKYDTARASKKGRSLSIARELLSVLLGRTQTT